jgi:thioredoxin-like negative regulator of GroEL
MEKEVRIHEKDLKINRNLFEIDKNRAMKVAENLVKERNLEEAFKLLTLLPQDEETEKILIKIEEKFIEEGKLRSAFMVAEFLAYELQTKGICILIEGCVAHSWDDPEWEKVALEAAAFLPPEEEKQVVESINKTSKLIEIVRQLGEKNKNTTAAELALLLPPQPRNEALLWLVKRSIENTTLEEAREILKLIPDEVRNNEAKMIFEEFLNEKDITGASKAACLLPEKDREMAFEKIRKLESTRIIRI